MQIILLRESLTISSPRGIPTEHEANMFGARSFEPLEEPDTERTELIEARNCLFVQCKLKNIEMVSSALS